MLDSYSGVIKEKQRRGATYIKEELLDLALLICLLEVNVAERVDNQDLAILSHHALLSTGRAYRRLCRGGSRATTTGPARIGTETAARGTAAAGTLADRITLGITLLHTALLAVHGHVVLLRLVVGRARVGSSSTTTQRRISTYITAEVNAAQLAAPGRVARVPDVTLDKLALPLPAHVQGNVVCAAADKDKKAEQDGAEARPVAVVVVLGTLPDGEAVGEEMVVAVALGSAQDVGHDAQAGLHLRGALHSSADLAGRWALGDIDAGLLVAAAALLLSLLSAVGRELLLDLVRVELPCLLAVRLVDVVEGGRGRDANKVVKCDFGAEGGGELVANAEDLTVWRGTQSV